MPSALPAWVHEDQAPSPRRGSAERVKRWVRRERERLRLLLGNACQSCGRSGDWWPLHFDHMHGRAYSLRALSQSGRVCRLRREVSAGLIQLLCELCNKRKGKPRC